MKKALLIFFQSLKTVDSFTLIALLIFWKPAFCIFYFLINCFRPNTANLIFENYSMSKVQNYVLKRKKEYDYCTQIWGKTNFIAIEKIMSLSLIFYYCFLYQRAFIRYGARRKYCIHEKSSVSIVGSCLLTYLCACFVS